ncbi:hypothetical protein ACSBR1_015308 [Camellia fascicularis]
MAKKTSLPPPISKRNLLWFSWKLVIALSISLCVLALLRLQHYSQSQLSFPSSSSSSSLVVRRSRILNSHFEGPPKVAFLFLARRNLPLDFLWGCFFESADVGNFSIYIHSEPGFVFDESTTRSAFFYNRQLTNMIKVSWGEASMIQAERLLLEAALEDPANQRFVLLSDSCVPLYNFSYIYNNLMASPRSFVDSFLDEKEGRYNPAMSPVIPKNKWRKGSQWVSLVRDHAEIVVDDEVFFPVFKKFCKRRPPLDASKGKQNIKLQKQHNCIPDEHYVQTLLAMSDLEGELERRTVTYTLWNHSATNMERKGWHPITFSYANAGPQQIKRIKDITQVYYETEQRTEWCSNNSTRIPCFLFARKFSKGAAVRLVSEGVVGPFNASALLETPL